MTDIYIKYSFTQFYAQTDRYGLFGSTVVVVVAHSHDDDEIIRDAVDDLEGGDNDAFCARDLLRERQAKGLLSIGVGATLSEASRNADDAFSNWYEKKYGAK